MTSRFHQMLRSGFQRLPAGGKAALRRCWEAQAMAARHTAARARLVRAAEDLSAGSLADLTTTKAWEERRRVVQTQLRDMLGLEPPPERGDLRAACTGSGEGPGFRTERIVFQSRPGLYATAHFHLPDHRKGPLPCILYLCGHWPSLDGAKIGYPDRYLWYPANGFALLVLDPMGFGEIPGVHPGTQRLNRWEWLSRGYTPAGVEVWNAMRALDWLESRPEIDARRIGVTGVSGGGVMTQYLAALDERVAAAAPSCSTFTLGDQAAKSLVPRQCDCTFVPNIQRIDFPEVLALIAPRPLLVLGGRKDPLFPPGGFREAVRRARRIYDLFGAGGEGRLRLVESEAGHTDTPAMLEETRAWMCRWLAHENESRSPAAVPPASFPIPRCLETVPPGARNSAIQDTWIRTAVPAMPPSPEAWNARRSEVERILRNRIFSWFPADGAPFRTRLRPGSGGYAGEFTRYREIEFDTEPGVPVLARVLTPGRGEGPRPLVVWVRGEAEEVEFPDMDEFHPLLRTHALLVLYPRFSERAMAGRERAELERLAALTGRSLLALRTWDVQRAIAWARQDRELAVSSVTIHGRGDAGLAGLYAAALDPAIGHVILRDPPRSHEDGAALPTILRHTDIDEVAAMLAPRPLSLLHSRTEDFPLAQSVFRMTGAGPAFRTVASVGDALQHDVPPSPAGTTC